MTNPFKQVRQKHLATLLMLAMVGASLHIFAHLRDHLESHSACEISQRDDSHNSGKTSFSSIHACSGCESLQHSIAASTDAAFAPAFEILPGSSPEIPPAASAMFSSNLSSRAPPLL